MSKLKLQDKKVIVFCNSIKQADMITEKLLEVNFFAYSYHSKANKKEADMALKSFINNTEYDNGSNLFEKRTKKVRCLVSINRLGIGFDCPDIEVGVQLRTTKIRSLYIQQIMRLSRKSSNKKEALYIDCGQTLRTHGWYYKDYEPPAEYDEEYLKGFECKFLPYVLNNEIEQINEQTYRERVSYYKLELENGDLSEKSNKELNRLLNFCENIYDLLKVGEEIYVRIYGLHDGRKRYNIKWIYENIEPMLKKYPEKKKEWFKAYRTRLKTVIRQGKKFYSLRFFIEWLVEQYEEELAINSYIEEYKNQEEVPELEITEDDEIDLSDCPF